MGRQLSAVDFDRYAGARARPSVVSLQRADSWTHGLLILSQKSRIKSALFSCPGDHERQVAEQESLSISSSALVTSLEIILPSATCLLARETPRTLLAHMSGKNFRPLYLIDAVLFPPVLISGQFQARTKYRRAGGRLIGGSTRRGDRVNQKARCVRGNGPRVTIDDSSDDSRCRAGLPPGQSLPSVFISLPRNGRSSRRPSAKRAMKPPVNCPTFPPEAAELERSVSGPVPIVEARLLFNVTALDRRVRL